MVKFRGTSSGRLQSEPNIQNLKPPMLDEDRILVQKIKEAFRKSIRNGSSWK